MVEKTSDKKGKKPSSRKQSLTKNLEEEKEPNIPHSEDVSVKKHLTVFSDQNYLYSSTAIRILFPASKPSLLTWEIGRNP